MTGVVQDPRQFFGLLAAAFAVVVVALGRWATRREGAHAAPRDPWWLRAWDTLTAGDYVPGGPDLPRASGAGTGGAVHPPGPGQPGWAEDDDATLNLYAGMNRERREEAGCPDPEPAELNYDAEPLAGAEVLLPVQGDYVAITYEPPVDDTPDDTIIDLRYEPRAGRPAWAPPVPQTKWDFYALNGWPPGLGYVADALRVPDGPPTTVAAVRDIYGLAYATVRALPAGGTT